MIDNTPNYTISVEPEATEESVNTLLAGLISHNTAHAGPPNHRALTVLLRDGTGRVLGGVSASTGWNWLSIKLVWVSEELRGQGWGRSLMAAAEQEAVAQGCTHVYLDTFSFQARGFYERLGYEVFGQLTNFPLGHTRYFLQKCDLRPL